MEAQTGALLRTTLLTQNELAHHARQASPLLSSCTCFCAEDYKLTAEHDLQVRVLGHSLPAS